MCAEIPNPWFDDQCWLMKLYSMVLPFVWVTVTSLGNSNGRVESGMIGPVQWSQCPWESQHGSFNRANSRMDIGRSGFRNPLWVGFVTHFGDLSMEIIIIDLQLCVFPGPFYFIGLFNFTAFWIPNSRKPSYCLAVRFAVAPCSTLINLRSEK